MPTARLPIDAAHRAASSDAHAIGAVTGLTDALAGKAAVAHETALTGVHGIVRKGARLRSYGMGEDALKSETADGSSAFGYLAAAASTSGRVSAFGYQAAQSGTTGYITALGQFAANRATTGTVVAVGQNAGYWTTTGGICAVGHEAAMNATTGRMTAIGNFCAKILADGSTVAQDAMFSTYVGDSVRVSVAGVTNETVIGYGAIGGGSNTVRLGNSSVTNWLPGATNVCALGNSTTAFKELYLHDGTDEWKVTINTSGVLTTTKV